MSRRQLAAIRPNSYARAPVAARLEMLAAGKAGQKREGCDDKISHIVSRRCGAVCCERSRFGAKLSRSGSPHRRSVYGRQRDRHPRPYCGRKADGTLGPAGRHRQPPRRGRNRKRGKECAGRLHADAHLERPHGGRADEQKSSVRSDKGFFRDHPGRFGAAGADCQSEPARQEREGIHRSRQDETGHDELRVPRRHQHDIHCRRVVQEERQHRYCARSLQGRSGIGDGRHPRRLAHVFHPEQCGRRADAGGAGARHRGLNKQAVGEPAGCAHGRRSRGAKLRL